MTTWNRIAERLAFARSTLSFASLTCRRRGGRALATALALVVGVSACKGKANDDKSPPKQHPVIVPTPPATPTTSPTAANNTPGIAEVDAAINRGIDALVKARDPGGMIGGHPGVTALAAMAMVSSGVGKDDPRLGPSLAVLASLAKPDGSIYEKEYPVYVTAMSTTAFAGAAAYPELVAKAQRWLADKQFAEGNKVDLKNPNYGGIGYGVDVTEQKADLSNLEVALDALKDSKLSDKDVVMKRAQKFRLSG